MKDFRAAAKGVRKRGCAITHKEISITEKGGLSHVYLNSVQQMVSGELAEEGLQTGLSRHGLPPQTAPLDTVYPLREHLNSVQ